MAVVTRASLKHSTPTKYIGRRKVGKKLTRAKANLILHEGEVRGHPLTKKQGGFFGSRASGKPVKRGKRHG